MDDQVMGPANVLGQCKCVGHKRSECGLEGDDVVEVNGVVPSDRPDIPIKKILMRHKITLIQLDEYGEHYQVSIIHSLQQYGTGISKKLAGIARKFLRTFYTASST